MSNVASENLPLKSSPRFLKLNRRSLVYRYGLAVGLVLAPLLLTLVVRRLGITLNPTWPILICLLLTSWYAGRGPCLLAAFLFALTLDYFFTPPPLVLKLNMTEINRLLVLLILAWITSARSRAEEHLRRQAQQQQAVARLAERALVERNLNQLLNEAVEVVARTLGVDYGIIWETLPGSNKLTPRASAGWRTETTEDLVVESDPHSLAGRILSTGEPIILRNLGKEKQARLLRVLREQGIRSGLGAPIPLKQGAAQVLAAYSRTRYKFSQDDLHFVQACAFTLAEASERLRIEGEREDLLSRERQTRAAAEEASRLKDEFLSTVSHELRTPLNTILGWVSLLRGQGLSPERATRALETIEQSARTQAQIVNDILDVSRIITGRLRLDFAPVTLNNLLSSALESMRPTAEAKGVNLKLALPMPEENAVVMGDATRLQQVFWNLLSNAIRFTPLGGTVQMALKPTATHFEISVTDTGEGISATFLPYIFDRFRQADSSTTRRFGGLGLGLSIVRHLVELHGGSVSAASDGEGLGASFLVSLPLVPPEKAQQPVPNPIPAVDVIDPDGGAELNVDLSGLSVLVVDDDPDACELVALVLKRSGAQVETASSAAEAFALLNARRPDVIVSDIGMPEEDGLTFIRRVRAMAPERGGNTPAAALSGFTRSEDRLGAIQAGFHTHVSKPVHPTELLLVVAALAKRN